MDILDSILTGGIGVGILSLIGQVVMWYLNNHKNIRVNEVVHKSDLMDNLPEVQSILNRVVDDTNIQQVLVMKTENGGGKPRLGAHLYATIMYETFKAPLYSIKNDYQRILVDDMYVKMLSDIGPTTHNSLVISKMKDGILKRIYLRDNVKYAETYYLTETDDAFFYMTFITTTNDDKFDDPNDRVEIDIAVSKIRNLFEQRKNG